MISQLHDSIYCKKPLNLHLLPFPFPPHLRIAEPTGTSYTCIGFERVNIIRDQAVLASNSRRHHKEQYFMVSCQVQLCPNFHIFIENHRDLV